MSDKGVAFVHNFSYSFLLKGLSESQLDILHYHFILLDLALVSFPPPLFLPQAHHQILCLIFST